MQSDIGSRRAGRRRAFQVLYGLCFAPVASDEDLAKFFDNAPLPKGKEPSAGASDFAWELTAGVWDHKGDLDEVVSRFSTHWKVGRIAKIELTILRLAVYEMLHAEETPAKVAINEAVELAKSYGDDNSKNFVNGILDAVAKAIDNDTIRLHQ